MDDYEIKEAFKNQSGGEVIPDEAIKCSLYEKCKGCRYPAHGFVCWNNDGTCLRTEMQGGVENKDIHGTEQ